LEEVCPTEFRVLGPVQAVAGEEAVPLGGPKQRALLAELLLSGGRPVTRDRLVDALWGAEPPASSAASLQVYVHGLRRVLGPERIETVGTGYRIRLEPDELDLTRFERLLDRASRALADGDAPGALDDVESAVALWRGPALADVADQPGAAEASPRLHDQLVRTFELRGDALLALGEHDTLLGSLEPLIREHPFRERLREQRILALYRAGRQAEALDEYRAARTALVEELGVEPGPALQELERSILRHDPGLAPAVAEPTTRSQLPVALTPLVGRRLEVAAVEALFRDEGVRLVTLTGPGGTGKTRLALAVAQALAPELRDGAAFVDLSALTTADPVLPAIGRTLSVAGRDDQLEDALVEHLRPKSILLVLDNLEQLGSATQPIARVLAAAPRVRVLATSRVPLRLSGEHDYPVPPLPVPESGRHRFEELVANDAIKLFAARARAAEPAFALTTDNIESVVAVCRRVDGLPLALELAAAWSKVLAPAALEARLGQALDLLVSGARDLPERQQTLRATLDWSYALLAEPERRLLADLSVFSGGWTLADAEAVVGGDVLAGLASLRDHSLVRVRSDRFFLLETIREYAAVKLAERGAEPELRRRHAERFLSVAEDARAGIDAGGDAEAAAFAVLDAAGDNLHAAIGWAVENGAVELEVRTAVALRWYWLVRGRLGEGARIYEHAATASDGLPALHAEALSSAALFSARRGELDSAASRFERARQMYAELGNEDEETRCIAELGAIAVDKGDLEHAASVYADAVERFERTGHTQRQSVALANLAAIATRQGNREVAADYGAQAIALQRRNGDLDGLGVSLANLGRAQLDLGELAEARVSLGESFEIAERLEYTILIAYLLGSAANLAVRERDPAGGARLLGAAVQLFASIGMPVPPEEVGEHEATRSALRAALGEEEAGRLEHEGRGADPEAMRGRARDVVSGTL
jgi:predicted ATPase/DNA-binding SARP family transcriptional activator